MDRSLAFLPTALRLRYGTEGQGRIVDESWECARRCLTCAGAGWQSIASWLDQAEPLPDQLLVLIDCAEVCEVTARSLMRGSPEAARLAALTRDLCARAAKAAEDEPGLASFVEAALRCARSCRSFAEAA